MKRMWFIVLLCVLNLSMINGMAAKRGCDGCGNTTVFVSREDPFCEHCEFIKFPDRFVACLFCRKPLRKLYGSDEVLSQCFNCTQAVTNFLVDNLKANDTEATSSTLTSSAFRDAQHIDVLRAGIKIWL